MENILNIKKECEDDQIIFSMIFEENKEIKNEPIEDLTKITKTEEKSNNSTKRSNVKKEAKVDFLALPPIRVNIPKPCKKEIVRKELQNCKPKTKFSEFHCNICQKYYASLQGLKRHSKRHYLDLNLFRCDHCNATFNGKKRLLKHLNDLKCRARKNVYFCDYCGRKYDDKQKIRGHVKTHAKVECKICHKKYLLSCIYKHIKGMHSQEVVECKVCKKTFKNRAYMLLHLRIHKPTQFKCEICRKKFRYGHLLKAHLKFHENPEQFTCKICGVQFLNLKLHLESHKKDRERKLHCDLCDFKSYSKIILKTHMKHHVKGINKIKTIATAVQCEKCPAVLKDVKNYKIHMATKHKKRPKFCCDFCGQIFAHKSTLKTHFVVKHGKRVVFKKYNL